MPSLGPHPPSLQSSVVFCGLLTIVGRHTVSVYVCRPMYGIVGFNVPLVGCVAQLVERRSLTGELSLSGTRPAADG